MGKLGIYLDTSVISFLFATDSPDFQGATHDFFENYASQYSLFISDIVLLEISKNKDEHLRKEMLGVASGFGILKLEGSERINAIAANYIESGVIPRKKVEDALHVAYATFHGIDIVLSWNFRHLANINKEHRIIIENKKMGYDYPLRLLSPLEVIDESDDD
jgi:predicted nucleic acid-binding protein